MLLIKHVHGASMVPWAHHNDILIAVFLPRFLIRVGQVVVFKHHQYGDIVKRLKAIDKEGKWQLAGDNSIESVTSEQMGWCLPPFWVAWVVFRVRNPKN